MQEEIRILFPEIPFNFNTSGNSFTVNYIKCRTVAIVYFVIHCYTPGREDIYKVKGERWIVDETWSSYSGEFSIPQSIIDESRLARVELVCINVDDDNPLHFTECMLSNEPYDGYHEPNENIEGVTVRMNLNAYVNVYKNTTENYLQIIRPTLGSITMKKIPRSAVTVLAPHIPNEPVVDDPENLYVEYCYQKEQTTNIKLIDFD